MVHFLCAVYDGVCARGCGCLCIFVFVCVCLCVFIVALFPCCHILCVRIQLLHFYFTQANTGDSRAVLCRAGMEIHEHSNHGN